MRRGGRTLTFLVRKEAGGIDLAGKHIARGTKVYADEAIHWDDLHATFPNAGRSNYSETYNFNGVNTAKLGSAIARLRRVASRQHHLVSAGHLYQYANRAAWKGSHHRLPNGAAFTRTLRLALVILASRSWKGYWQRTSAT